MAMIGPPHEVQRASPLRRYGDGDVSCGMGSDSLTARMWGTKTLARRSSAAWAASQSSSETIRHSGSSTSTRSAGGRVSWVFVPRRWAFLVRRSEEHTSELQSHSDLVCRLLLE